MPSMTLREWFHTRLGQALLAEEQTHVNQQLAKLYSPIAVQVGMGLECDFLAGSEAHYHIYVPSDALEAAGATAVAAIPECLPFEAKSVGLIVLPHVVEFTPDAHQVLREVHRVLVPEGHVVILGFNPVSVWGLCRVALAHRDNAPWTGHFVRLSRVKDWLAVLGFETVGGTMVYYLPPLQSDAVRNKLGALHRIGDRWWPMMAAVYVLVARKRQPGVTPIVPAWKENPGLSSGIPEPVARSG